jgi:hypothetical protein
MRLTRFILVLVLLAACGDDTITDPTIVATTTTTTTTVADTTTIATTTTVPPITTTTLGTGPLSDSFDDPTTATPYFGEAFMSFDTSVSGEVTIAATSHDSPGLGSRLFASYPHLFRDGTMRMVFSGAPDGSAYYFFLRASTDLSFGYYTEIALYPSEDGTSDTVYVTVVPSLAATPLNVPPGTYDPIGFNTLRIDIFDGTIDVFLNGTNLGQVIDPGAATEGIFGFGIIVFQEGASMTVDEFVATPEVS